jgi:predicted nucleic acid-binding protein
MNGKGIDFIADTSAVVRLLRRDSSVEEKVKAQSFAIVLITLAEIYVGVLKADKPEAALQRIREVLTGRRIIFPCERTATRYARIYHDLERRGEMIPVNDIWIAAIAIQARLPLLARDEHFSRVRGLSVVQC